MKYIISESQLRTLDKSQAVTNKMSEMIDRIIFTELDPSLVCDYVTIKGDNYYITIILSEEYKHTTMDAKLQNHISKFLPVKSMVLISGCYD